MIELIERRELHRRQIFGVTGRIRAWTVRSRFNFHAARRLSSFTRDKRRVNRLALVASEMITLLCRWGCILYQLSNNKKRRLLIPNRIDEKCSRIC